MDSKKFDYYIFIDYSENLIGYNIIEESKIPFLVPKIQRFRHYNKAKNKKIYIKNIRESIKRENILSYFIRNKIKHISQNMEIYADVLEFLKNHKNCIIFVSIDNQQYPAFRKIVNVLDGNKVRIEQESELKENSLEYKLSLVLDNLLNIERLKQEND